MSNDKSATMARIINGYPVPGAPTMTRSFPRYMEFLLPLRMSARNYGEDEGVIVVSSDCPETHTNEFSSGDMYAMTVQVSIQGHGAYVRETEKSSGFMSICEPVYAQTNASMLMNAFEPSTRRRSSGSTSTTARTSL
ncbi:hypothetical protein PG985_005794 [Apiospora marii]|uniref:uncharacterized protein n=1 Tax=Apiospora marii TaxID=335849 RepID=UPI00312CCB39